MFLCIKLKRKPYSDRTIVLLVKKVWLTDGLIGNEQGLQTTLREKEQLMFLRFTYLQKSYDRLNYSALVDPGNI